LSCPDPLQDEKLAALRRGLAARRLGRAAAASADIARAAAIDPEIAQIFADYGIAPDG